MKYGLDGNTSVVKCVMYMLISGQSIPGTYTTQEQDRLNKNALKTKNNVTLEQHQLHRNQVIHAFKQAQ